LYAFFIIHNMNLVKSLVRKRRKKESFFKYTFALLHLWLGLLASLVVLTVCLTGSIYVFKNQIIDVYNKDKVYVTVKGIPITLDQLESQLLSKNLQLNSLIIPKNKNKSYIVTYTDLSNQLSKTNYLNPYTGEILGASNHGLDDFFAIVLDIHRTLLVNNIGKQIVGVSTLIMIFMLVSGLVLWWPKKWKDIKTGLSIKWKAKFYRVNYDIHNTLGFYAMLFLMFIAITGVYITYPWMKSTVIVSLGGNPVLSANTTNDNTELSDAFSDLINQMVEKEAEKETMKEVTSISLDSLATLAYHYLPYQATTIIKLPDDKDPRYQVRKINTKNWLGAQFPDEVSFDKLGVLKSIDKFMDKPLHKQFIEISKPLHTGEILGLPSIILYFILSLIGCSLPITGFIIWWKKAK
jgi:uncharacterized iron-regulated membrane protein